MKKRVFEELKRLYPNAIGFSLYKTQFGALYIAENNDGMVNITDVFKDICLAIACDDLFDMFNKNC